MKVAVLGTGMVGRAIAGKLVELGHEVMMGGRSAESQGAREWTEAEANPRAQRGSFAQASAFAELVFNATKGEVALEILRSAGAQNLDGKILVDITNPLDFSNGMPPTLSVCNDTSLGEQIQAELPGVRVVKTLNTVSAPLMVNPGLLPADSVMFLAGNDASAKERVEGLVLREWFGWKQVVDLGDISCARGTEMYLPLWIRLWGAKKTPLFNLSIVTAQS